MDYQKAFQQMETPSQTYLSCCAYTDSVGGSFPEHCHSFYEISYIIKGSRFEMLNHSKFEIGSNSLVFIPPLSIHGLYNITEVEDLVIQFDHLFVRNASMLFGKNTILKPAEAYQQQMNIKESDALFYVFMKIRDCCKERDNLSYDDEKLLANRLALDLKINSLCLEVITYLLSEEKILVDLKGTAYSSIEGISLLINEIMVHPDKTINMKQACEITGMSYSHFSRFFKKMTGFNYIHFYNLFRIRHAEELLLTTDMSISEVAKAIGIETIAYFTKLFKRINGSLPSLYRKKYKN